MTSRLIKAIGHSVTIAAKLSNLAGRQHKFQEGETLLDNKKITGFRVHTDAIGKSFDQDNLAANAVIKKCFLTLVDNKGQNRIDRIPLETFFNSNGVTEDVFLDMQINIRKSFIDLPDSTGATADTVILITFFFEN